MLAVLDRVPIFVPLGEIGPRNNANTMAPANEVYGQCVFSSEACLRFDL